MAPEMRAKDTTLQHALSILVVEDDAGDFGLLKACLKRAGLLRDDGNPPLIWAQTLAEGTEAAGRYRPDLILLDLSLPDSPALVTVKAIRVAFPDIPIVVLTGREDDDLAMAVLEAGAQDYLIKNQLDSHGMARAVRHAMARKQAQDALRASEESYRGLLNNVSSGVVVHGPDTSILLANPAAASLLGLSQDQLLGKTAMDPGWRFLRENGTALPLADYPVNRVLASGEGQQNMVVGVQTSARTEPVWVLCNASPLRDQAGKLLQVIVTFTDITERKKAEAALQLMSSAIERSPALVVITDPAAHIEYVNPRFTEVTGYSVAEVMGKNPRIFASGLTSQEVYRDMWAKLTGGLPWHGELINCRKDGEMYWEETHIAPVTDAAGKLSHYVAVKLDITERKKVEQALAETEDRFNLFMDTLPAAAFIKDRDSTTVYANRTLIEIVGGREWLGKSALELFPPDLANQMIADDRRALEAGSIVVEEMVQGADGRGRLYETHKFSIPQPGKPPLLGGISLDITERKKAEQELRLLTLSLESQVRDRTKQLREMSAQLMLTEERERRLLAENLHDNLGQLLAAIKIRMSAMDPIAPRSLGLDKVVGLVDQADLAVRAITQSLSPSIMRTLGLIPALEALGEKMRDTYGLDVQFKQTDVPPLAGKLREELAAVLYRSVRELLINVVRHAKVARARLSCAGNEGGLTLVVSDQGCGLAPAAGDKGAGDHFGLSSIHERMINIGGTMNIDSSPGRGVTVTLTVPWSAAYREASA